MIVHKITEILKPRARALRNAALTLASTGILLFALSKTAKIHAIYGQIKTAVLVIVLTVLALYLIRQFPALKLFHRILKIITLTITGVLFTGIVFMTVWYSYFFFPDDREYLQAMVDALEEQASGEFETVELDLIRGLGRAVVANPLTDEDREFLLSDELREKEFYIDRNFYGAPAHPNNLKYSTGMIFYYTSQKNSVVMKDGSRLEYPVSYGAKRFIELDAVFPSLDGKTGDGVVRIYHAGREKTLLLERRISREKKPGITPFRYSSALATIPFYLRHPARSVLTDNTGWERLRADVPSGGGRLIIEFESREDKSYLFLGSPRLFSVSDAPGKRPISIMYLIFDCFAKNHIDLYEYPELFAKHTPDEAMKLIGKRNTITPALNRYAKEAILFDAMYSVGQVTRASIVPLWTSRSYTESRLPVFRNIVTKENQEEYHAMKFPALGDILSAHGYFTKQISCNAQGHGVSSVGVDLGFEENYDYTMEASQHTENIRRIIEFLKENRNRKFLLYSHINTPHSPHWIPLGYYLKALWEADFIHHSARTLGNIRFLNDRLGDILQTVEKLGLRENTLIVVTADHSFGRQHKLRTEVTEEEIMWGRHESQQVAYFHGRSIYVRKGGPELYRSTMNIPFVVIPPRSIPMEAGKITSVASTLDISPTFLDLTLGKKNSGFTGRSFREMLTGAKGREGVFADFIPFSGRFQRAFLLDGRYKYWISLPGLYKFRHAPGNKKMLMQQEYLFDYASDPYEIVNLALDGRNPELLTKMRKVYRERFTDYPDKNFLQIAPLEDGKSALYTITARSSGRITYPNAFSDETTWRRTGPGSITISAPVKDKRVFFSFETDPSDASLDVTIYRDNVLLPKQDIFSSVERINIFGNPLRLMSYEDFHIARFPGRTGLEPVDIPAGTVYFSRIPINYWLEMSQSEKDIKLSPGIKEVLRGWGYIQ